MSRRSRSASSALAGGGIVRGLALAGRLGPVANALRAVSTRSRTDAGRCGHVRDGQRAHGGPDGRCPDAGPVVRPLLRGRTEGAIRAGREGLTEGASEGGDQTSEFGSPPARTST